MQQQQHQYKPQPAAHGSNALLSQDLLRQLQLGQSRMQAAEARTYPQQPSAGPYAYQQATPAYLQGPRSAGLYGGHEQPHVQVGFCLSTVFMHNVHMHHTSMACIVFLKLCHCLPCRHNALCTHYGTVAVLIVVWSLASALQCVSWYFAG